jgi:hypothetical protein
MLKIKLALAVILGFYTVSSSPAKADTPTPTCNISGTICTCPDGWDYDAPTQSCVDPGTHSG